MNTSNIKKYAPLARNAFITAVTKRANELGIYHSHIEPAIVDGQTLIIEGRSVALKLKAARDNLISRVESTGFTALMEFIAYTWFNRLCAIRFMELHDYLDHGLRVLSHPENNSGFEILDHAQDVAEGLGLNRDQIIELKLAGNQDELLYRTLLLGQCHALHQAMPFLFVSIDDETELLLPDNLTRTDSILRGLVDDVPEQDWLQVEVIGWLYQFYISEKKDAVMGKVVKSEDIPAATQLFTPNWIVKYLVQNSVGRQWLQTYPDSSLKAGMDYYIEPAEQTPEVGAALAAITPDSIEPENIKVLDPACGSGHILVEAYHTLKAIYQERGYQPRKIPQLILENNLFGLDVDDRAVQLAGFALMMLARADDRRIFSREVQLNVMAMQSGNLGEGGLVVGGEVSGGGQLIKIFEDAKTLGSLIAIPELFAKRLPDIRQQIEELAQAGDIFSQHEALTLLPLVKQAQILAQKYDVVIANPPYMGSKGMNKDLKTFAKAYYPDAKSDLFAMFMEHGFSLLKDNGFNAQVNMQSWMFLSSYEKSRQWLLETKNFITMAHLGARAFSQISGEVVQTTAWVLSKQHIEQYRPVFFRLIEGNEAEKQQALLKQGNRFDSTQQDDFKKIPGSPIAYWVSENFLSTFGDHNSVHDVASLRAGMSTGDNTIFQRLWCEIDLVKIQFDCVSGEPVKGNVKWFPCNSGGQFRKWYGNNDVVVDWENNGQRIKKHRSSAVRNVTCYFKSGLTYSKISSGRFAVRQKLTGFLFDDTGRSITVEDDKDTFGVLGLLCSEVAHQYLSVLAPSLSFTSTEIGSIPFLKNIPETIYKNSKIAVELSKFDWDSYETSWDYKTNPLVQTSFPRSCVGMQTEHDKSTVCIPTEDGGNESAVGWVSDSATQYIEAENVGLRDKAANPTYALSDIYAAWQSHNRATILEMQGLEQENNRLFIDAYGLQDELTPDVPLEQITLIVNPKYRYGGKLSDEILENRFQSDTLAELISYAIGCMMGRYSLDQQGLVYAHAGNQGFSELVQQSAYQTFPADKDGIIPLTDQAWFADDATHRLREFVRVVWGEENHQQNLDFIAESLCLYAIKAKNSESSLDTIRRYLATQFYKDHLKTYKKRPIYWLFSSGKQKAFECLVYLHRYNESTLSRMRTEYVTPLLGKYEASAMVLQKQMQDASSTSDANRFKKSLTTLEKKQTELSEFDDKLKHYADMRISLDLDDGVKVNYGKFGDLLADVKAITGKK